MRSARVRFWLTLRHLHTGLAVLVSQSREAAIKMRKLPIITTDDEVRDSKTRNIDTSGGNQADKASR